MSERLTFLAVHAHPDDEASSTGGTFPLLQSQGVRTVLVTCTNGEFGDAPGGIKPDETGHDPDEVAALRQVELDTAASILRIDRVVRLGYRDSGMVGWPQNHHPSSFWATPLEDGAARLAEVLTEERPQVVMTYNDFGFYGHPDHIQAHRITMAALDLIDYEPTVYFNAIPKSVFKGWRDRMRENDGISEHPEEEENDFGTADDLIAAIIDVRSTNEMKFDALAAHASQISEDSFWMKMGREGFMATMVNEWFTRERNPRGLDGVVSDLFAGYR
ncbi:MAG: PIG-L family deacetylase [Actinomycetota bacterium]